MITHIKITAKAGSKKESVMKEDGGRLVIHVREKAENGRANKRILEIVRSLFPEEQVRLVSGEHSSRKIVAIGTED